MAKGTSYLMYVSWVTMVWGVIAFILAFTVASSNWLAILNSILLFLFGLVLYGKK